MDSAILRHSTAHVMAAAVSRLFPGVKLDIGDSTEDGTRFYYDFDLAKRLAPEDFPAIEAEMGRIVKENLPFERVVVSRADAHAALEKAGQTFKLDRLASVPEGTDITFYKCGAFSDLCRGPHVNSTGEIKAFRLVSVAGSYFRGDVKNPMLQRVYGTAAETTADIDKQLKLEEEAKLRDHRKLGKELDLFSIQEDVGPGLIHWHPRGGRLRSIIEDFWKRRHFGAGYELLYTPHIGRSKLWETSGHLGFYKDSMYSPMEVDENEYFIKPMNCPFHIQIYKTAKHSYRELPLRWAELGTVYRYEKSGVLNGLFRVRGFTQDDAHIFCQPEKIEEEIAFTLRFALDMLRTFGFEDFSARLSTRPEKAVGEPELWNQAIASLEHALQKEGIKYQVDAGGGAFYGPKIDLDLKDTLGRPWQLSTIQFDFNLPERFDLTYVGEDGKEHRPYMVHRALLGSLERFLGILIEHYAGSFPVWLAPEQVRILPITDKQNDKAGELMARLNKLNLRATVDWKADKIGAKIRRAQAEKVPYMAVLGGREVESGTIALRDHLKGDLGAMKIDDFVAKLSSESVKE